MRDAVEGGEKSMQMIIYDRCKTFFRSLYNFGRKPVGVESIYQLLELQRPVTNVINASEF